MRVVALHPQFERRTVNLRVRTPRRLLALGTAATLFAAVPPAHAESWGFSSEIGAITSTVQGTPAVFRITTAKVISPEFSAGPTFYVTPAGDAQMYSGAFIAEFHALVRRLTVAPFIGMGLAHRRSKNDSSTALMFPLGSSVDFPVGEKLFLRGTMSFNIHNIDLEGEKDDLSVGLTAGISYRP